MALAGLPEDAPARLNPAGRQGFGDFQINGAMAVAKRLRANPREIAQQIADHLDLGEQCSRVEVAGSGFINLTLRSDWLSAQLEAVHASERLGVELAAKPATVVVDYSSPNVAKEMHVGHLRGTILGDSIVRVLEFLGHRVIRQNHIGDWGTQFGMLIAEMEEQSSSGVDPALELADLEQFYRRAKTHFDEDAGFADRARNYVVKLQSGDAACLELWRRFIEISLSHADDTYAKLGVTLSRNDVRGESAYNDALKSVVDELRNKSIAEEDQGAQVVFLQELADRDGNPSAFIVQKAAGGYLYATTDLAAVRHRVLELKADRCLYFIDARQSLHMQQVFATARLAGWVDDQVELMHCSYGTIMGADGTPFKTRSGDTIKLSALLDEAVDRAARLIAEKTPELSGQEADQVARAVGIGAVKYADLSKTRTNDYLFDWEAMLSFEGNTAPYLQYAYTRIQSILRRAPHSRQHLNRFGFDVQEPAERALALVIVQFPDIVEQIGKRAMPHELCNFVFDLSGKFMTFYEACPILQESVAPAVAQARLKLADLTGRVIRQSLDLLGIKCVDRM